MNILSRNDVRVIGDGPRVLLYAHGFGCNKAMWDQITPAFASTHRQIIFDYVGSGNSDLTAFDPQKYSYLSGYAQDLLEVCDALDLHGDVSLVAHSVSCSIGLLAAIQRSSLFDKLVLLGPNPCFLNVPPDYQGGFERDDLEGLLDLMDQNYMGWADYLAPVVSGEDGGVRVSNQLSESFCSTDPVAARIFAKATFFSDNRSDLANVRTPALILQHRYDALAPLAVGTYMHKHLPSSTLKVLDVKGHCAHLSNPQLVIDAMRTYLQAC